MNANEKFFNFHPETLRKIIQKMKKNPFLEKYSKKREKSQFSK